MGQKMKSWTQSKNNTYCPVHTFKESIAAIDNNNNITRTQNCLSKHSKIHTETIKQTVDISRQLWVDASIKTANLGEKK